MILRNAGRILTLFFALFVFSFPALAGPAPKVPDATVTRVSPKKIELVPPAGHHFNVKAPNQIRRNGKSLPAKITEQKIQISVPAHSGAAGAPKLEAVLFLCDEASSYCVRKVQNLELP